MAGVRKPEAMTGQDLSRILRGREPPERPMAHGGYGESHYLRTSRWAYMSDNLCAPPACSTSQATQTRPSNVADRHPAVLTELRETLIRRAGGRPPYYGT